MIVNSECAQLCKLAVSWWGNVMHEKKLYHLSRKDEEHLLCLSGDGKFFDGLKEEGRGHCKKVS